MSLTRCRTFSDCVAPEARALSFHGQRPWPGWNHVRILAKAHWACGLLHERDTSRRRVSRNSKISDSPKDVRNFGTRSFTANAWPAWSEAIGARITLPVGVGEQGTS